MLIRKVRNTVFNTNSNLTNAFKYNNRYCFFRFNVTIPEFDYCIKNICNVKNKMKINVAALRLLQKSLQSIPRTLKDQSAGVLQVWAHQCECVFAQRLRRGQQMFSLYSRLWEEHALKEFLTKMRKQVTKHGKELIASAIGVSAYGWEANRITNQDMCKYLNELDYIHELAEKTMTCKNCRNNQQIITCKCTNQHTEKLPFDKWVRFLEKEDMVVWRKECEKTGTYEYKVYGSFNDVSAEDFLNVQIDTEYRKKWDNTAIILEVIERDPIPDYNSDIIYWEMLWPKLFINRDYVFNRRFMIDDQTNTIVLMSRGTEHPACPIKPDKYRVDTYWSYMVIKPYTELDKPGIEFGLTYFDDPGVNVPSTVTTWVAMRAMPDYLTRLRIATKEYQAYCEKNSSEYICKISKFIKKYDEEEKNKHRELEPQFLSLNKDVLKTQSPLRASIENVIRSHIMPIKGLYMSEENEQVKEMNESSTKTNMTGVEIFTTPSATITSDSNSSDSWKYLHPNYYFT